MKTIQIPSPTIDGGKPKPPCVDFGDTLKICFSAAGTFVPDSNGLTFSPQLVQIDVPTPWYLTDTYTAPSAKLDVTWTFTPSNSTTTDLGTIQVRDDNGCRDASQPPCGPPATPSSGQKLFMKTIQIPGSLQKQGHDDDVGYDCDVDLHFTAEGVFWRSKQGNSFTPSMFQGYATPNSNHTSKSPHKDLVVEWRFIDADGKETDGKINVKKDASCSDSKTAKPHPKK